jgi:peptide/nickel transport system permease protein
MLILFFSVHLRWLPLPGDDTTRITTLVLPSVMLASVLSASLVRHTRSAVLSVLNQQYVLAARARGMGPLRLIARHVFRNAASPLVTIGALQVGGLLSGTVVAEKLFERQGIGTLFLEAFFARDIPVVQGCVLVVAVVVVVVHLLADAIQVWINPLMRHIRN